MGMEMQINNGIDTLTLSSINWRRREVKVNILVIQSTKKSFNHKLERLRDRRLT